MIEIVPYHWQLSYIKLIFKQVPIDGDRKVGSAIELLGELYCFVYSINHVEVLELSLLTDIPLVHLKVL